MNKRIVAGMLFTTVVCMTLGGCGFTADKENVKNSGAVESIGNAGSRSIYGDDRKRC